MDLEKHGDSDASKQEHENQAEKPNDDNAGVGRSYECTFCKRGFTNAQALGGHMNIHRKDKAKAKAKQTNLEEPSNKSKENHTNLRLFMSSSDHQRQIGHQRAVGAHMNYQVYLPSSNPSFQAENSLPLRRPDFSDVNLRLGMGTSPPADGDGVDSNVKESEVDLELRLGHDP